MNRFICIIISVLLSSHCLATNSYAERKNVKQFIHHMHQRHQFDENSLTKLFSQLTVKKKILNAISTPYEKKPWRDYRALFITKSRIKQGVQFYQQHRNDLKQAEIRFGVSPAIIVAILGVETNYGRTQGHYPVLSSLSTLAFDYPKRSRFFKKELAEYLLLCRELNVSPLSVKGSYAGAIGQPQFMPSSYRYYAVHPDGEGTSDLRHNTKHVIFSVANYFKQHGWQKNKPVATPAIIKGEAYRAIRASNKSARYHLKTLKRFGVLPKHLTQPSSTKAGLVKLANTDSANFWIAYPNFYVITRYNTSKSYATVVHLLSQEIEKRVS